MTKLVAVAVAALAMGAVTAQAQWTYVDATDFLHDGSGDGTTGSGPLANTWLDGAAKSSPWQTDLGNGTDLWRYRYSGPGGVAYNTTAFAGRANENDPPVFTVLEGLTPDTDYTIRLYGVWTGRNNTWGLAYSLNGGATWSDIIDRDVIEFANDSLGEGQGWVDTSNGGVGELIPFVVGDSTDTRGTIVIGLVNSGPSGVIEIGVRGMPNSVTERGVYDGLAYAEGLVPEPTTFALAGLGTAALLIIRRRR